MLRCVVTGVPASGASSRADGGASDQDGLHAKSAGIASTVGSHVIRNCNALDMDRSTRNGMLTAFAMGNPDRSMFKTDSLEQEPAETDVVPLLRRRIDNVDLLFSLHALRQRNHVFGDRIPLVHVQ